MNKQTPWTVLKSDQKYCRDILEVCEDQVIDAQGKEGTYSTVKMPPGICVIPFDDEGFVYLTREFRYALGRESIEACCLTRNRQRLAGSFGSYA